MSGWAIPEGFLGEEAPEDEKLPWTLRSPAEDGCGKPHPRWGAASEPPQAGCSRDGGLGPAAAAPVTSPSLQPRRRPPH